jgi:hypothetical protein
MPQTHFSGYRVPLQPPGAWGLGEHLLLDSGSTIRFGAAFTRQGYKRILPKTRSCRDKSTAAQQRYGWLLSLKAITIAIVRRICEECMSVPTTTVSGAFASLTRRMLMLSLKAVTGQWKNKEA